MTVAAAGDGLATECDHPGLYVTGLARRILAQTAFLWCRLPSFATWSHSMLTIDVITLQPLVALIAGLLILVVPRLLNFIVALYLIIIGVIGLLPHLHRLLH